MADEKGKEESSDLLMPPTYCCSQTLLSRQLAQLHPDLTMPMFSEITYRFQTARPEVRQLLLQYLLPWLHNMELVDPNVPPISTLPNYQFCSNDLLHRSDSRREGWGSAEATEMVLNNLFYITVKFADEHAKEVENVWATLSTCWPNNMKIIIRYLIIISGMAPNELLTYTKRVTVYLARAGADKLLDEMLIELQTVETLNCLIERTETPPFYRLTSIRKVSNYCDPDPYADQECSGSELSVEKGTIHTKRHSNEESAANNACAKADSTTRTLTGTSRYTIPRNSKLTSLSSHILEENVTLQIENELPSIVTTVSYGSNEEKCSPTRAKDIDNNCYLDIPEPHPLPMPEYGGYFAPLREYLPETVQPSSGFHRCNVAVMLLTDVVVDSIEVDWSVHLPLMLHMLFLGLDQGRNFIYQHCKQLLLNLLVVVADHADNLSVAQILLTRKTTQLEIGLPTVHITPHNFTEPDKTFDSYLQVPVSADSHSSSMAVLPSPTETIVSPPSPNNEFSFENIESLSPITRNTSVQNVAKALIDFLASRKEQVLWNYEDITAKVWSVKSVEQLDIFLQHVLRIFQESLPHALISERWAQIALQLALSCSSRHIAGRSLQVFRFLRVPITSRMLSDILSRLVETVAEQGEDMQGYVTELLLTLESAVDSLDSDFRSLDYMKEIFKSTPNLHKDLNVTTSGKRSVCTGAKATGICLHSSPASAHTRSTSYTASYHYIVKTTGCPPNHLNKDARKELGCADGKNGAANLNRSRSVQSLKLMSDTASQDDKMTILAQLFWLGVSLLESDYEHEYLLALRLLGRVLGRMPLDRPDTSDKVEKIFNQLKWTSFQGVHSLLLKGCSNPSIYESVVPVLSEFILFLDITLVDPSQGLAFPLTLAALLPYLVLYYEDANELSISIAENITQASSEKAKNLENLAMLMSLYSRRTFNKESFQWTKCVMKYIHDAFPQSTSNVLSLLVDLLEKGPSNIQFPVLSIIHCLFHYIDVNSATSKSFNVELLIPIIKQVEGPYHKEAIKILKTIVTRSAVLLANPSFHKYPFLESHMGTALNPKLTGISVKFQKELPGRTMDFTFDKLHMSVIPKYKSSNKSDLTDKTDESKTGDSIIQSSTACSTLHSNTDHAVCSPRRSSSLSPADNAAVGWKRPWLCQSRVRECLVSLLSTCGQRVGLPKSPSVIFSQSSDLLEKQSSMASSTEEVSGPDLSDSRRENVDHFGVFKDFDFLEYESESVEGESTDNFNWGVRRRPLGAGEGEGEGDITVISQAQDSISETTPLSTVKKLNNVNSSNNGRVSIIDDSSDEELGSDSPSDEIIPNNIDSSRSSSSLRLLNNEDGRDTPTHSDISDSSVGELGDLTPCNVSPHLPTSLSFRPIRNDNEELWRVQICSLMDQVPLSSLHLYHIVYRLIKEVVHKSISLTQIANGLLTESEGEGSGGNETLQTRLSTVMYILTDCTQPPFVWFNANHIPLTEFLHFDALQLREHLDTLLDRKDHVNEYIDTFKAILKLQRLREDSISNDITIDEVVCDLGRALYKFLFQLLLLLDSAEKMYHTLKNNAAKANLEDVSSEVTLLKKSLIRTREEYSDYSEDDASVSHELMSLPCKADNPVIRYLESGRLIDALKYMKKTRIAWPNDLICSATEENEIINIVSIYCSNLLERKPDAFVVINEELSGIHNSLMDELLQILNIVNELELHIKEQKRKH